MNDGKKRKVTSEIKRLNLKGKRKKKEIGKLKKDVEELSVKRRESGTSRERKEIKNEKQIEKVGQIKKKEKEKRR